MSTIHNLTDNDILNMMNRYEKHKVCCRNYMKKRYYEDPVYCEKVRKQSRDYYDNHRTEKKAYYEKTKHRVLAKRRWEYAIKKKTCEKYKTKYPIDYDLYIKPSLETKENISIDIIDETKTTPEN